MSGTKSQVGQLCVHIPLILILILIIDPVILCRRRKAWIMWR